MFKRIMSPVRGLPALLTACVFATAWHGETRAASLIDINETTVSAPAGAYTVYDISSDGKVLIGYIVGIDGKAVAYQWSETGGIEFPGDTAVTGESSALGTNADGSVTVGGKISGGIVRATAWTSAGPMTLARPLGFGATTAQEVNGDGTKAAGYGLRGGHEEALYWDIADNSVERIGLFAGGSYSMATDISDDGRYVVGTGDQGASEYAFLWDSTTRNMRSLGTFAFGTWSMASGISGDGSTVVGAADTLDPACGQSCPEYTAFRWRDNGLGLQDLGLLEGGTLSEAIATNGDGSVVVGMADMNGDKRAFRWTANDQMMTVEDWLRRTGMIIPVDMTYAANAISADGNTIVGTLENGHIYVAWVPSFAISQPPASQTPDASPDPALPDTDGAPIAQPEAPPEPPDLSSPTPSGGNLIDIPEFTASTASSPATDSFLNAADMVIYGAHGSPMRNLLAPGRSAAWVTGDIGYDSKRSGTMGTGEIGLGYGLEGDITARFAFGASGASQSLPSGGDVDQHGVFVSPEATWSAGSLARVTLTGYLGHSDIDIRRGYENAGVQDFSNANTANTTLATRLRVDLLDAVTIGNAALTPYGSYALSHSETQAYTETGGSVPIHMNDESETSNVFRLGTDMVYALTDDVKLLARAEGAYRLEKTGAARSGEIIGLTGFAFNGMEKDQLWGRGGLGAEVSMGKTTATLMLNGATDGDDPSIWVAATLKVAF